MNSRKGFTLTEVVICMAIILIISSAALITSMNYIQTSNTSNIRTLAVNEVDNIVECFVASFLHDDIDFEDALDFYAGTDGYASGSSGSYTIYYTEGFVVTDSSDATYSADITALYSDIYVTFSRISDSEVIYEYAQ